MHKQWFLGVFEACTSAARAALETFALALQPTAHYMHMHMCMHMLHMHMSCTMHVSLLYRYDTDIYRPGRPVKLAS